MLKKDGFVTREVVGSLGLESDMAWLQLTRVKGGPEGVEAKGCVPFKSWMGVGKVPAEDIVRERISVKEWKVILMVGRKTTYVLRRGVKD